MVIYTVSEITNSIRDRIKDLGWVWVQGEISNLVYHSSGHIYFSIKDENSLLKGVVFRSATHKLDYELEEGRIFQLYGRIDIWERGSQYQLITEKVIPGKIGDFYLKFQQIKEKLEKEGLFASEYKKELPSFPKSVGIITSGEGAAVIDTLKMLKNRAPYLKNIVRPTMVQGEEAALDIIDAIKDFEEYSEVDLIIITRGGGSIEDLWVFNDERVARAIFECPIPVISAVGHERDFTISDFVSDIRAATPTEAGQIAVPSSEQLIERLSNYRKRILELVLNLIDNYRNKLQMIEKSYAIKKPLSLVEIKQQNIDHLQDLLIRHGRMYIDSLRKKIEGITLPVPELDTKRLKVSNAEKNLIIHAKQSLKNKKTELENLKSTLMATSYERTLSRGFSIVRHNSRIIKDSSLLDKDDRINIKFYKGSSTARIEETED